MELIKIDSRSLKVILTKADMDSFCVSVDSFSYKNVSSKRVLWEILDKAKADTGFDAGDGSIYVQVFPDSCGGCEMFVTKYVEKARSERRYRLREKEKRCVGVILSGFDALHTLSKRIASESPYLKTSLFLENNKSYILIIEAPPLPSYVAEGIKNKSELPDYLSEYGKEFFPDKIRLASIFEKCEKICDKKAAQTISKI